MKNQTISLAFVFIIVFCGFAQAQPPQSAPGLALTVYNDNFAVVRENRTIDFQKGINTIKFTDVASQIDPTSVTFESLSVPGSINILEQNYEYDLLDTASLLKRYIDKPVKLSIKGSGADIGKEVAGILSAASGRDMIIASDTGGLSIIDKGTIEEITLAQTPEDLVTKPTLVWLADSQQAGSQLCRVSYTTNSIKWSADYSAILNQDDTKLDFSGLVLAV